MNKQKLLILILFFFINLTISMWGQETHPLAVSPGSATQVTSVLNGCPTFSWSAVSKASSYRLVVFPTSESQSLSYEEVSLLASPVISKNIIGTALSWTIAAEESLPDGQIYTWFVVALDETGNPLGQWSPGKRFKVLCTGLENKLADILKANGISDSLIHQTMAELQASTSSTTDRSGIMGTEGASNTFYGLNAGFSITSGTGNSFFGNNAGYYTTTGYGNTFLGDSAGYSNSIGYQNTYIGSQAGACSSTAVNNTFIGNRAGYYCSTGSANTIIGQQAGILLSTGGGNTFLGYSAGSQATIGNWNTFAGNGSGLRTTTAGSNTFFGAYAGAYNTVGTRNTFFGYNSGYSNTSGNNNLYVGQTAGYLNTTGSNNTIFGNEAGYSNVTGEGNVFLGYKAGYNETGSNKLYIDNSDTTTPLIYGEFDNNILTINGKLGINTQTPQYTIEADTTGANSAIVAKRTDGSTTFMNATTAYAQFGSTTSHPLRFAVKSTWKLALNTDNSVQMSNGASCTAGGVWTNASSRALKENIQPLESAEAVAALEQLQPVKYNYISEKNEQYLGFIAEDVPELVASKDRKSLSPMDITAILTSVLQEQLRLNQEQEKTITELRQRLEKLEKQ